jgi:hypothetical protein
MSLHNTLSLVEEKSLSERRLQKQGERVISAGLLAWRRPSKARAAEPEASFGRNHPADLESAADRVRVTDQPPNLDHTPNEAPLFILRRRHLRIDPWIGVGYEVALPLVKSFRLHSGLAAAPRC